MFLRLLLLAGTAAVGAQALLRPDPSSALAERSGPGTGEVADEGLGPAHGDDVGHR